MIILLIPFFVIAFIARSFRVFRTKPRLLWGVDPVINHKYHARAMKAQYVSDSFVVGCFSINNKDDFDVVLTRRKIFEYIFYSFYVLFKYDIYHFSFNGGLINLLGLGFFEPFIYRIAGIKVVVIAFGSDVQVYEEIQNNIDNFKRIFEHYFRDHKESITFINNDDWLSNLNYIELLRDVGSHLSINRMLTFESVKERLKREQSLSFLEFNYMLLNY